MKFLSHIIVQNSVGQISMTQFQAFRFLLSHCFMIHEGNVFVYNMVKLECAMSRLQPVGRGKERGGMYAHCLRPRLKGHLTSLVWRELSH